jgi:hypothetical protein
MTTKNRSLTGTSATQSKGSNTGLTFPGRLIYPPQSQVARTEDAVTDHINQLDVHAQQLGQGFGISFTSFVLNPLLEPASDSNVTALAVAIASFLHRAERVSLERRSNRWGLYFTREAALVGSQDRKTEGVPLKDAPLDVREKFLLKSEEFFRDYLDLCRDRLAKMHDCVAQGDRTLALLHNLTLE